MSVLGELFDFWWQVHDGGYEVVRQTVRTDGVEGPVDMLQAKAGTFAATQTYHFEDVHNGLFRHFASLKQTPEAVAKFASEFGLLRQPHYHSEQLAFWYRAIGVMKALVNARDQGRYDAVYDMFNREEIRPRFSAAIYSAKRKRAEFRLVPENLLGAMWLQLANQTTKGIEYKQCEFCPNWFPVGPGTGRKPSKKFCSGRCRLAAHRRQSRLGSKGLPFCE